MYVYCTLGPSSLQKKNFFLRNKESERNLTNLLLEIKICPDFTHTSDTKKN